MSTRLRKGAVDVENKRLLITNFNESEQKEDFTLPPNCNGLGRIRHFKREGSSNWPSNPLPIDPACTALGLSSAKIIKAQVFQNAICNWRCWYCYVDFKLLAGNIKYSEWVDAKDLMDMYLQTDDPPPIIDLTGGQPDLVPEWVLWMMTEIKERGLDKKIYLWSDDNLSNDYFWKFLTKKEQDVIASYKNYGRVCCFKGMTPESFAFNTVADPSLFSQQFELIKRLIDLGLNIFAYITLTTPDKKDIFGQVAGFLNKLQKIHNLLPLRTIPLEVKIFTPVKERMNAEKQLAIKNQYEAIEVWKELLEKRFTLEERSLSIADIKFS